MITNLEIKNYAIIENLSLEFSKGLNILTGETGSGKSIILGAFGLILGNRADSKTLRNKTEKCIVEASFDISNYHLAPLFERENLDYDDHTIVRREINSAGKSRAFVNDTPVNLKTLRDLGTQLVDLHQQFGNQGINDPIEQVNMLDSLAGAHDLRVEYAASYNRYRSLLRAQKELQEANQEALKQQDFITYQLNELHELDIDMNKDVQLEQQLQQMDHATEIISGMGELVHVIRDNDQNLVSVLLNLLLRLQDLGQYHPAVKRLSERLESAKIELTDIAQEAGQIADLVEVDDESLLFMRERMDRLNNMLHKHHVNDLNELLSIQERFEQELAGYTSIESQLEQINRQIEEAKSQTTGLAEQLSIHRQKAKPNFEKGVNSLLSDLKMEHALFKIDLTQVPDLTPIGKEKIQFLFAPNKGSEFRSTKEVASGGELSRLALIAKSLVANSMKLPTLIFDEIDSGVSGDVAQKMGQILQDLSKEHQLISITHSPQVAARADLHFKVFKTADKRSTKAKIILLSEEDRIVEIATMLSSSPPSNIALESAKELIQAR